MRLFARGRIKTTEVLRFALAQRRRATWLLLIGTAHREIVALARCIPASLIVVGIRRRGLSSIFLGSTAERVIARASCPVLTVPGRS